MAKTKKTWKCQFLAHLLWIIARTLIWLVKQEFFSICVAELFFGDFLYVHRFQKNVQCATDILEIFWFTIVFLLKHDKMVALDRPDRVLNKFSQHEDNLKNEDFQRNASTIFKNEEALKNQYVLKNVDNLHNEEDLKNENELKNEEY